MTLFRPLKLFFVVTTVLAVAHLKMIYYKIAKWYTSYPLLQASNDLSRAHIKASNTHWLSWCIVGISHYIRVYLNCITRYTLYYSPNCSG